MAALTTRLRYVKSSDPDAFQPFLERLRFRVMVYQVTFQGGKWWLWYVPPDDRKLSEIPDNIDLD